MKESTSIGYKVVKVVKRKLVSTYAADESEVRYKLHKAVEAPYAHGDLTVFSDLCTAKDFHDLLALISLCSSKRVQDSYRVYRCAYTKGEKKYLANKYNKTSLKACLSSGFHPYARYAKSVTLLKRVD